MDLVPLLVSIIVHARWGTHETISGSARRQSVRWR